MPLPAMFCRLYPTYQGYVDATADASTMYDLAYIYLLMRKNVGYNLHLRRLPATNESAPARPTGSWHDIHGGLGDSGRAASDPPGASPGKIERPRGEIRAIPSLTAA